MCPGPIFVLVGKYLCFCLVLLQGSDSSPSPEVSTEVVQRLQWKEDLYNCFCLFSLQGSDSTSSPEDSAAICIQKWFRGYNGRKIYITVFACFHFRGQIRHQTLRIQLPSVYRSGSEVTREGRFI